MSPNLNAAAPTVADAMRRRADATPDRIAFRQITSAGVACTLSYGALAQRVEEMAGPLAARSRAGDRVLLVFGHGLDFIVAFLACQRAGLIPAPMSLPRGTERSSRISAVEADCAPALALSHRPVADQLRERLRRTEIVAIEDLSADAGGAVRPAADLAFLQYTSGSTGQPKGVMVSHANLHANMTAIARWFGVQEGGNTVSWLPSYHDMGLVGTILVPILTGVTANLMAPEDFVREPLAWLKAVARYGAEISGGPNFAYELCAKKLSALDPETVAPDEIDLSRWRVAFVGAEPVHGRTLARFAAAAAPFGFDPNAFLPCYGLAEATLFVSGCTGSPLRLARRFDTAALQAGKAAAPRAAGAAATSGEPAFPATELICCGDADSLAAHRIRIVDPVSTAPREDGGIGEIWVSGPDVAAGYWGRPPESDAVFRARRADDPGHAYLRTGDLGFISEGRLFIAGRLTDLIIVNGVNYYPQDIENSAAAADPALPKWRAAAFAIEDDGASRIVVCQEIDRSMRHTLDSDALERKIRQAVLDNHGLAVSDVVLLKPGGLPLTSSGKVQRRRCKQLYTTGALAPAVAARAASAAAAGPEAPAPVESPATEGQSPLTDALRAILAETFKIPAHEVDPAAPMNSFAIDSLKVIEIQMLLEARHGVAVPAEVLQSPTPINMVSSRSVSQERDTSHFWNDAAFAGTRRPAAPGVPDGAILLTGATGLVGSHLADILMRTTRRSIYCLVRGDTQDAAAARLAHALSRVGLSARDTEGRIVPVAGDVSLPGLGLGGAQAARLAEEVGIVYHNAATLDFLQPYGSLKAVNVEGCRNILAFAASGRAKRVAHVSSVSVLESPVRAGRALDEETVLDYPETLPTGYAQTKWVADVMMLRARDRGIDTAIFRPPWILGESQDAQSGDFVVRFLRNCIAMGALPDSTFQWNIVPPRFVASAVAALVETEPALWPVYHLGARRFHDNGAFAAALTDAGARLDLLPPQTWRARLRAMLAADAASPFRPLASLFFQSADGQAIADPYIDAELPTMDSRRTLDRLAAVGLAEPAADPARLAAWIAGRDAAPTAAA